MAAKKKAKTAADADKIIVAFALRDFVEGDDEEAVTLTQGQRLELAQDEFDAMAAKGIVAEGIFVKMKTAVEGGRYSLKPHDTTWLAPLVYEAWKTAGYCEPTEDDPQVGAVLKAREEALREAVTERNSARLSLAESQMQCDALSLELAAAKAQAETVIEVASGILDGDEEVMEPVKVELQRLIDMLPDQIEGAGNGSEPQLNLN